MPNGADVLRVAFITYEYPPRIEGGAGVYALSLTRALAELGLSVTVFTPWGTESGHPNLRIRPVAPGTRGTLPYWLALGRSFNDEVRTNGPFHVIHSNSLSGLPLIQGRHHEPLITTILHVTRRLLGRGIRGAIARVRDVRGETGVVPLLEGRMIHRSNKIIAISERTRADVLAVYGLPADRVHAIHLGIEPVNKVDHHRAASLRRKLTPEGEPLILYVGRLEQRKGPDLLLRAAAQLRHRGVSFKLVLAGHARTDEYSVLANQLGIADITHFIGHVSSEERDMLYIACDIFVMPSRYEGFGLVALEVMAHGRPVVATNTGIVADGLIDEANGSVVPTGDWNCLASALEKLLRSPKKRAIIGDHNRYVVAQRFNWQATATATLAVYGEAIKQYYERTAK